MIGIEPLADKWRAFGWDVQRGRRPRLAALAELLRRLRERPADGAPAVVIAHTVKGKGIGYMEPSPAGTWAISAPRTNGTLLAELRGAG